LFRAIWIFPNSAGLSLHAFMARPLRRTEMFSLSLFVNVAEAASAENNGRNFQSGFAKRAVIHGGILIQPAFGLQRCITRFHFTPGNAMYFFAFA
jgi:hypothetical protein